MNIKLKPPCWVTVEGHPDKVLALRSVSQPNKMLMMKGWNGLVAHVQNRNGTGLVEYRKLRLASSPNDQAQLRSEAE